MKGKIAFKILDANGKKIAYIGKSLKDDSYLFPKGYRHNHVYNLCNVLKNAQLTVTADPFEALALYSVGMTNICSLLHQGMTEAQENLLKEFPQITLIDIKSEAIITRLARHTYVRVITDTQTP